MIYKKKFTTDETGRRFIVRVNLYEVKTLEKAHVSHAFRQLHCIYSGLELFGVVSLCSVAFVNLWEIETPIAS